VVFVGYGIVAPEYNWNDYAGVDVRGKTVLMLVNDPGYATGDSALFTGRAMTYYGRWTYKFEEAARQGAAAALLIHETGPAGYPWAVVQGSWSGPQFTLANEQQNMDRCALEGWLTYEAAQRLLRLAGRDLEQLKAAAAQPGFRALPLGLQLSAALESTVRQVQSRNVLALLPGQKQPDEVVIYTAHWDHLGVNPSLAGDSIYNGALDNATGTAGLLALAHAFTTLPEPPARSVLFLAVTAEEQGLLGSTYYATHPVFPPAKTVAVLNMDGLNVLGPMRDVTVIGYGLSDLDDYAQAAAAAQGRYLRPDPEPEKGYYYRSDHFSFARIGIPALYLDAGIDHVVHGTEWTLKRRAEYVAQHYHKPSDEYNPSWDLHGAVDDLRLLFHIGYQLANSTDFPNWREGTPFRALRDQQRNER
jgi:Zn-dependent M28 family amino/carboxypeptidase